MKNKKGGLNKAVDVLLYTKSKIILVIEQNLKILISVYLFLPLVRIHK